MWCRRQVFGLTLCLFGSVSAQLLIAIQNCGQQKIMLSTRDTSPNWLLCESHSAMRIFCVFVLFVTAGRSGFCRYLQPLGSNTRSWNSHSTNLEFRDYPCAIFSMCLTPSTQLWPVAFMAYSFPLLSGKPSIAISYDRKVTCLMEELSQSEYCVDIRSFKRDDLLERFSMLRVHTKAVQSTLAATCRQYDEFCKSNIGISCSSGSDGAEVSSQRTREPFQKRSLEPTGKENEWRGAGQAI